MAYFLFVDESGQNLNSSPSEVIAGVAIEDKNLWNIILEIKNLEIKCFGMRYPKEIKAKRFLVRSVFKKAQRLADFSEQDRQILAKYCLENGPIAGERHIVALEQAKLAYVMGLLEICNRYRCKIFATISKMHYPAPAEQAFLPKNYVYLLERFYYFLDEKSASGILVFDELDKAQSHLLVGRIENYFKKTIKGRLRSSLIIPEPFFVHSDLTTGIQVADLIAYIISWGFRPEKNSDEVLREEFAPFIELIKPLRYRTVDLERREVWSVVQVKK